MGDLYFPVGMAFLPDGRLVVAEKQGTLRLIVEGKLGAVDPFGTVDSVQSAAPRKGLLGVAVDARWPGRPYVYVCYDALGSTVRVSRYKAVGDLDVGTSVVLGLDPESRYDVLRDLPDTSAANGCGALRFGPDSMLYVSLGDGNDPCSAQDTTSLRGVVLRLEVSGLPEGAGGPPDRSLLVPPDNPFVEHPNPSARLVWTLGLRNPFRFHVDRADGALFIADVGESAFEEINRAEAGGLCFGWPYFEGGAAHAASCAPPGPTGCSTPVYAYGDRSPGGMASVIGGDVYRGAGCTNCNFPPGYEGDYFFSDYYAGFLRRLKLVGGSWQIAAPVPGQPSGTDWGLGFEGVSDYATGPDGALWYCRNGDGNAGGEIHRIVYVAPNSSAPAARADGVTFSPPFPSPASGAVRFAYALPRPARVTLVLFDAGGRPVRRVVPSTFQSAGRYSPAWDGRLEDGREAAPGVYLARLRVDGASLERRVALLR